MSPLAFLPPTYAQTLTALTDLEARAAWPHFVPFSHRGGRFGQAPCHQLPLSGEPGPFPAVLRKGETVVWLGSTRVADAPNPTDAEQSLLWSVYTVADEPYGRIETLRGLPSLAA